MYYNDHMPPHFHAEYNGNKALVLAWCTIHQDELMQNWELTKDMKPLNRINPLI